MAITDSTPHVDIAEDGSQRVYHPHRGGNRTDRRRAQAEAGRMPKRGIRHAFRMTRQIMAERRPEGWVFTGSGPSQKAVARAKRKEQANGNGV